MDCSIEWDEWLMVDALVSPADTVLELGARFGTTSCALSKATGNSGGVVSVETDVAVTKFAEANREIHQCNFALVRGSVSSEPLRLHSGRGYDLRTREAYANESSLPQLRFRQVESMLGRHIDTLLLDCEGCIGTLLTDRDEGDILSGIKLVLMEHDSPSALGGGYGRYFDLFRRRGFEQIWLSQDTFCPSCAWSRLIKHSAWRRVHSREELSRLRRSCWDYARSNGFSRAQLTCLNPALDDPLGRLINDSHSGMEPREIEAMLKRLPSIHGSFLQPLERPTVPVGIT